MQLCWTYDSYTDRAVLFGDSHGRAQECASEALLLDHGQLPQATYTKAKNELCSPLYMQVWNQLLIGDRISDMQVHIFLQADRYLHKRTPRNDTYWRAITQANWILLTQAHVKTDKVYIYMYVEGHKQRPSRHRGVKRMSEQMSNQKWLPRQKITLTGGQDTFDSTCMGCRKTALQVQHLKSQPFAAVPCLYTLPLSPSFASWRAGKIRWQKTDTEISVG